MKKALAVITIVALLAIGVVAFAHGPGFWGSGHMTGSDYGYGMGPGYGGHMYGQTSEAEQKFLDETTDLRKELHNKKFEYFEATRKPETGKETITKLEKEISELQDKLYEKSPRSVRGIHGKFGCW